MPPTTPQVNSRYGWFMVAIAPLFLGLGNGGLGAISVFLKPVSAEFGWLRGETAFAYLAASLALGAGGIVMGHLADRYSTRRIVQMGVVVLGLSFLAMAYLRTLWQFYLLYLVMGGIGSAALFAPMLANVGGWFTVRKGLAIGLATAGQALAQGGVPYLCALLIAALGWRSAYLALSATALVVLLPITLLIRQPPAAAATSSGGTRRDSPMAVPALPSLALLSAAAIFCCITMATPLVHAVALASDSGLTVEGSARVLLVVMIAGVFGRIAFGRFADEFGALPSYVFASLWQSVLVYWFIQMRSPGAYYFLAAVFGFGYAGVMTCLILCSQQFAPPSRAGVATGVVAFFGWIGMGTGAYQAGYFFDITGDYRQSFLNAALAGAVNLAILGVLAFYRWRHRAPPALQPDLG